MIVSSQLWDIAGIVGVAAALRLADVFGGQEGCCVPHRPRPDHPWAVVLGTDEFSALCAAWGGCRISIPRNALASSLKVRMQGLARQGLSHRAIARELRCTERWVRMVLNDPGDARQGDLFRPGST